MERKSVLNPLPSRAYVMGRVRHHSLDDSSLLSWSNRHSRGQRATSVRKFEKTFVISSSLRSHFEKIFSNSFSRSFPLDEEWAGEAEWGCGHKEGARVHHLSSCGEGGEGGNPSAATGRHLGGVLLNHKTEDGGPKKTCGSVRPGKHHLPIQAFCVSLVTIKTGTVDFLSTSSETDPTTAPARLLLP